MGALGGLKPYRQALWLAIFSTVILGSATFCLWFQFKPNTSARKEVRQAFAQIRLGNTPAQVKQHFSRRKYQHLKLRFWSPTLWVAQTPFEWGANNWYLHLDFNGNALIAKRVRVADHVSLKPLEPFPPDEMTPGGKSTNP